MHFYYIKFCMHINTIVLQPFSRWCPLAGFLIIGLKDWNNTKISGEADPQAFKNINSSTTIYEGKVKLYLL